MKHGLGAGAVALAAVVAASTAGMAAPRSKCALPAEVTAIQAAAVQQQLMVAALTCNQITNFNAFQTGFSSELRSSDRRLQSMFQRLYGGRKGTEEYHAFKTRLANDSSIRSIHDNAGYCQEAQLAFAAALTPSKPALADFVSAVAIHEENPVDSCEIRVAPGLLEAKAAPEIMPRPNPLRVAALVPVPAPVEAAPTAGQTPATGTAAAPDAALPAASTAPQAEETPAKSGEAEKKHAGWFSGIFN